MYLFFGKSTYHKKYLFPAIFQQKPWKSDSGPKSEKIGPFGSIGQATAGLLVAPIIGDVL